jgi:hypothetical protein
MTPTALALALATATSAFLPIAGQPTDDDLVRINDALAPILLKVTYDRANGIQNLWGLIANANKYLHHYGLAFARPATCPAVYGPAIAEGASRVERTRTEAAWAARIQDYEAYKAVEAGVKTFIEAVVKDTWIRDLRNPETFYSNVTALALLNHLRDRSGSLHAPDMVSLTIQMSQYYEGTPIIPEYIQLLKDAQRKAARASLPVTNQTLTILASTALLAADTFPRTTILWEELAPVDKTWPAWKAAYLEAHKLRANRLRATGGANNLGRANQATFGIVDSGASGSYYGNNAPGAQANQATNFLDSIDNALDNLASAATNNKAVLEKLVATNSSLTASNSHLANQIKSLQTQLAAKKGQGGGGGGGSGRDATTKKGPNPVGYCLSHRWRVGYGHNSITCEHPKEGHQSSDTCQNTKGGSSANKDWIPRTTA